MYIFFSINLSDLIYPIILTEIQEVVVYRIAIVYVHKHDVYQGVFALLLLAARK